MSTSKTVSVDKEPMRREIKRLTAEFVAAGGKIEVLPPHASGLDKFGRQKKNVAILNSGRHVSLELKAKGQSTKSAVGTGS